MKKVSTKWFVAAIVAIIAVVALVVITSGCQQKTATMATANDTVAVSLYDLWSRGEITVLLSDGSENRSWNVVDYVAGDPAGLLPDKQVVGIYTTRWPFEKDVTTWAILTDGTEVRLKDEFALLPRSAEAFDVPGIYGPSRLELTLRGTSTYSGVIYRDDADPLALDDIVDAWAAYDTVYWMTSDGTVWKLDWESATTVPEVFFVGANGVSHHADEAEGALVSSEERANFPAYGRPDICSPYGD